MGIMLDMMGRKIPSITPSIIDPDERS